MSTSPVAPSEPVPADSSVGDPSVQPRTPDAPSSGRVVIFGNPYSGSGPNRKRVERMVQVLEAAGVEVELVWDKNRRDELLAESTLAQSCRCLVSAGGDGSLTDVLNGLDATGNLSRVAIYHFPVGTENLFAAEFGHTLRPEQAAAAIIAGKTRPVDLGRCNGRLFHLMVSAGLDADVVHRVDRWRQLGDNKLKRVNQLKYAPRLLGSLAGYDYHPVTLTTDDGTEIKAAHVFVFNLPRYGGGLTLGKLADPTDGMLDYIALPRGGMFWLAHYGLSVLLRRHLNRKDIPRGRARRIELRCDENCPAPMQLDGDPVAHTPATVEVVPGALRVIVPAG